MFLLIPLALPAAADPASVEAWLPELEEAVEQPHPAWLRWTFAEFLQRTDLSVGGLRAHLDVEMVGHPEVDCRGALCRVRFVREEDHSSLVLHRVHGAWRLWDQGFGDHVHGPVVARVEVLGPGGVEVRVNGVPTYLFDEGEKAVLDRHLAPGFNLVTLVPRRLAFVSFELHGPHADLAFDGRLEAPRTFLFEVGPGPGTVPD